MRPLQEIGMAAISKIEKFPKSPFILNLCLTISKFLFQTVRVFPYKFLISFLVISACIHDLVDVKMASLFEEFSIYLEQEQVVQELPNSWIIHDQEDKFARILPFQFVFTKYVFAFVIMTDLFLSYLT